MTSEELGLKRVLEEETVGLIKGPALSLGLWSGEREGESAALERAEGEGCPWQTERLECARELQIPAVPSGPEAAVAAGAGDPPRFLSFPFSSSHLWRKDDKYRAKEFQNVPYIRFT